MNNLNYCNETRNIDNMLYQFKKDRDIVINLLSSNYNLLMSTLWSNNSPINIDKYCLCNMGHRLCSTDIKEKCIDINLDSVSNFYICSQCKNMSRLIKLIPSSINCPFYIESGVLAGKMMMITKSHIDVLYTDITKYPYLILLNAIKNNPSLSICQPKINNYITPNYITNYIGSDPFTNQVLITWYLDSEFSKYKLPHISKIYTSFICGDNGYCLSEYSDIGSINKNIKSNVAIEIIKQLFVSLHLLNTYDFSHGEPTSKSIIFSSDPCSYIYEKIRVDSPITLKLCNLNNSGITIQSNNRIRLYCKSSVIDEQIKKIPSKSLIEISSVSIPSETITVYRLKNLLNNFKESILYMYLKHLGIPLFQSSFDVYAFMIVLMADVHFYTTVNNTPKLFKFWKSIWLPDDFENVCNNIKILHMQPNSTSKFYTILLFLSDFNLRCNILSLCWNQILTW